MCLEIYKKNININIYKITNFFQVINIENITYLLQTLTSWNNMISIRNLTIIYIIKV